MIAKAKIHPMLITLLLASCVSAPKASPQAEAEAKSLFVPAGKSKLYIIRPSAFGLAVLYQVAVDGTIICGLPAESFLAAGVEPGSHNVSVFNSTSQESLAITCDAGKPCFVRVGMHPAAMSNRARMKQVGNEEGRALVRSNTMIRSVGQ